MDILNKIQSYIKEEEIYINYNTNEEIYNFLLNNPTPNIDDIQELADKLSLDVESLTLYAWKFLGSFCAYGYYNESGKDADKFDTEELMKGIEIEMEHTNDEFIARRIAYDHLAEISDYYTRLEILEKDAGVED